MLTQVDPVGAKMASEISESKWTLWICGIFLNPGDIREAGDINVNINVERADGSRQKNGSGGRVDPVGAKTRPEISERAARNIGVGAKTASEISE